DAGFIAMMRGGQPFGISNGHNEANRGFLLAFYPERNFYIKFSCVVLLRKNRLKSRFFPCVQQFAVVG
ncbi:hypothetical protein, partial [Faecalibacterium longum]|uniref:hypothetical protein n=1 Tax=Faecalibacterium longum TaxID=1851428 RepID=UPI001D0EE106